MALNFLNRKTIVLLFLISGLTLLSAHPHINIQAYAYNYFNDDGLQGIYMQWEYDPMFSSQLIYNYDSDENYSFSEDELKELKSKYFNNIAQSGYYSSFKNSSGDIKNPEPVSFKAVIDKEDEVVIISFFVPLNIPYSEGKEFKYSYSDSTSYTAFAIPQRELWNKGTSCKITDEHINKFGEVSFSFSN